ncbi:MAG: hypothetical protein LAP38_00975 [Acidobacteriia bacterium]|nr:hypothetical protein [Terriglobia bacterium]
MSRAQRIAYYGLPMLFCLAVHWLDLRVWFHNDDFAWLGLPLMVHSARDLVSVLFSAQAQGTVRTLSERLFFLVFTTVFGLHSPPFRVWVFLTQFANIALLMSITRRLTGSAAAGFLAAILWTVNASLADAIGWSAAYNEIAFAFFILLAFRLLLLYIDTGQRKFWIWQWVVFILGFGALELNVVYPVLAAGYALCCARDYFRKTLLLFIPSVAYAALHFALVPAPTDPYYQMHFDSSVFTTLWQYWSFALGALRDSKIDWRPLWLGMACTLAVSVALACFAAMKLRRRNWLPLLLIGWFVAVLLPLLPLKNHFTEYYVSVPAIGLAMLGGWALAETRGVLIPVAAALAALYVTVSIADNRIAERFEYDRARKLKYLVTALQSLPPAEAHKKVILAGVDNAFFWTGFHDDPFRLIGVQVYLAPGSEQSIDPHPEGGGISKFVIPKVVAVRALRQHQAGMFQLDGRRLSDISAQYLAGIPADYGAEAPDLIDVGDTTYQSYLGPTWYAPEQGYRWMPKTATLKMAGPKKSGATLEISGFCPAVLLSQGPLKVSFRADGSTIGTTTLSKPAQFYLQFPLPGELTGKPTVEIAIEVDRTTQPSRDSRQLGLVFGTFRMK